MEQDINKLIEELTKVRPDELSKEGLKLFNKINEIIDKNKELEEENKELKPCKYSIDFYELGKKNQRNRIELDYIPVSLVEEKILNPMKEEHDKAIKGFIKRDIPQCIEDGGIAQELGYFIGKIEELLEKRK